MRPAQAHINREPYTEPTLRKLSREQAALFLVGYAYIGHQGARDILEILFPVPNATKVTETPGVREANAEIACFALNGTGNGTKKGPGN